MGRDCSLYTDLYQKHLKSYHQNTADSFVLSDTVAGLGDNRFALADTHGWIYPVIPTQIIEIGSITTASAVPWRCITGTSSKPGVSLNWEAPGRYPDITNTPAGFCSKGSCRPNQQEGG